MKYYIIAGEASGDLHGSNLVKNLKLVDKDAEFRGLGGDKMTKEGVPITIHYEKMAFMGVTDVLANLKTIKENFRICKNDILDFKPDAVILIDYAGFNLRMAKFTKENKIKTLFYISPKVWAWKKSRVKKIKALIDQLYLILPFEKDFYAQRGYTKTFYVGNPLTDSIHTFRTEKRISKEEFITHNKLNNKPIIALLAGSRIHEIKRLLPEMLEVSKHYPHYQFVVAGAPSIKEGFYKDIIKTADISIVYDQTYQLLSHAHAAIVTSGTATLETGLFRVPQVVIYKFQTLSFLLARPFIWVKYFSLVNIIMDKDIVKEILQFGIARKVKDEMDKILNNKEYYETMLKNYDELINFVGKPGTSERTAKHMYNLLSGNNS